LLGVWDGVCVEAAATGVPGSWREVGEGTIPVTVGVGGGEGNARGADFGSGKGGTAVVGA
jgi:hypothetical protein